MGLSYFVFDAADDGEGNGSWEAAASVKAAHLADAQAEAARIEATALADAPGTRAPLEDGGAWDLDLHTETEGDWTTLYLTINGPWAWGEALLERLEAS